MQRFYIHEYPITSDTHAFILDTYVVAYKYLKVEGHAKKVFLILVSNGQLNGEIMKYEFFKFFIL